MRYRLNISNKIMAGLIILSLLGLGACAKQSVNAPTPGGKGVKHRGTKPYTALGRTYRPYASARDYEEVGLASWYGPGFHGKRTSSGEIYNMHAITAAHKLLPLHTWVEVTNLGTGASLVVRINDRGPFVDGRIIDLSRAAANKLGVLGPGVAKVRVTALGNKRKDGKGFVNPPSRELAGPFAVQVGAFVDESRAYRLAANLRTRWGQVQVVRYDRGDQVFHRVRVGKANGLQQARDLQARLRAAGLSQAFAVAW